MRFRLARRTLLLWAKARIPAYRVLFQKSRRRARLGGFERVGANEFGKRIAFVRARGFCGTHFVHFDGKTSFEKLQRALAPRKSAADNFYCLFAHIFCIIFIIEK